MGVSYTKYIDYLYARAHGKGIPFSGTFELTARCNLDCKMCYIHKRANDKKVMKEELSAKQWLEMGEKAQKEGTLLLLLTGGEPLLRPDFKEIYTGLRNLGILLSINTNATMINDEMVDFFKNDPPIRMNITLYGASPETYERLCGDRNAYFRAYHAVKALKEAGIRIKINYSTTKETLEELPAVYQFAKDNEFAIQVASYMFPPLRACENCEAVTDRLSAKEAGDARFAAELLRYGDMPEIMMERAKAMLAGKDFEAEVSECMELPTERIRCRAGDTNYWVTYKGEMRPCGMLTVPTINSLACGFVSAWDYIHRERQNIMVPAKCTACELNKVCEVCPAACYSETGKYEQAPEYACERTRVFLRNVKNWLVENSKEEEIHKHED